MKIYSKFLRRTKLLRNKLHFQLKSYLPIDKVVQHMARIQTTFASNKPKHVQMHNFNAHLS